MRTRCCHVMNAATWKLKIFISLMASKNFAIKELAELKSDFVDCQNSVKSLSHELDGYVVSDDKKNILRVEVELALENAEVNALANNYKNSLRYVASRLGVSEYDINKRVDTMV